MQITPTGLKTLEAIRELQEKHVSEYLRTYSSGQKAEVLSVLKHIVRKGKQLAGDKY